MQNILRINPQKFKTKQHIIAAFGHNARTKIDANLRERIYPEKMDKNTVVFDTFGVNSPFEFQKKLMAFYDEKEIKIKPDNVLMLEFIISASPEFFETSTPQQIAAWEASQLEFAKEQFGDNLKYMVKHEDEKTPHFHLFVSTEILSTKKYKNQKGEFFKTTWSLNAKRFDPDFLVKLHDAHAVKNDRYGLVRGVEGSTATHTTIKDFSKRLKRVLGKNYERSLGGKLDRFLKEKSTLGFVPIETAKKVLLPFLKEFKLDIDCLKFHIDDRKKREKVLKVESDRLKKKEENLNKLLDDFTNALKQKNQSIDDLLSENSILVENNEKLMAQNKSQAAQIVNYQNKLKALENSPKYK